MKGNEKEEKKKKSQNYICSIQDNKAMSSPKEKALYFRNNIK